MKRITMVLIAVLSPAVAGAQEPAGGHKGLNVEALPIAYVIDDQGVRTRGRLLNLDHDDVVLLVGGAERRFEIERVRRIEKRGDSLKNGAITGAVVGAILGTLGMAIADCPGYGDDGCFGVRVAGALLATAFYAGVGTGIDAAIQGRTVLYQAPPAATAQARRRAAVGFRVSW